MILYGPGGGGGGGGELHKCFGNRVQYTIIVTIENWTQWDLRFCKSEWSKRSKINEKGGQLDRKSRRELIQNA